VCTKLVDLSHAARIQVHQAPQPGHLPHCDAAAAPVGGLASRQTLVVGHRQQRAAAGAPLRVPDCSVAFTERSQHRDRQSFEPAFPVGPFFPEDRLGIQG
jgi:hypothetical protein